MNLTYTAEIGNGFWPASAPAWEDRVYGPAGKSMTTPTWEIAHSVETNASPAFAWNFWTDVANWVDPPARFELDGPFATGVRGTTWLPGQEPLHWFIRDVTPPSSATIEMSLDGASVSFHWRFEGLADGGTRLTQRIALQGEKAELYLAQVKAAFTANLPGGMNKMATAMANADPSRKSATSS